MADLDLLMEGARFSLVTADIFSRPTDAMVVIWRHGVAVPPLAGLTGFAHGVHRSGGPTIFRELRKFGVLPPGAVVATKAGKLPAEWVIHAAVLDSEGVASQRAVFQAATSAMHLAVMIGARTVSLPLLGAGTGRLPSSVSLGLLLSAWLTSLRRPDRVEVVVPVARVTRKLGEAWGFA